jgi:hypothetical protein
LFSTGEDLIKIFQSYVLIPLTVTSNIAESGNLISTYRGIQGYIVNIFSPGSRTIIESIVD